MSLVALVFLVYGVVGVVAVRPVAGHIAWTFYRNCSYTAKYKEGPDGEQWFGVTLLAVAVCAFWPVALIAVKLPVIGAEREARLKKREERVRELEKKLELRA